MYIDLKPLMNNLLAVPVGHAILAVLIYGEHKDSISYIKSIRKRAKDLGVVVIVVDLENVDNVLDKIKEVQALADAVIPIKPFPDIIARVIKLSLDGAKDVDNFTGKDVFKNCTVEAIEEIFKFCNIKKNKRICILGRKLGLQIGMSLLKMDFTPVICHSQTPNSDEYIKESDVIITVTGARGLIKGSMVKRNSLVIDVGLGDVEDDVYKIADVTPEREGVGAITTEILFNHINKYKEKLR